MSGQEENKKPFLPGDTILLIGSLGESGAVVLLEKNEKRLKARFSNAYLKKITPSEPMEEKKIKEALPEGEYDLTEVTGGLLSTLFILSEKYGCGMKVDLKQVPVRQEIVEVCEALGKNPYTLESKGAYLLVIEHGARVRELLKEANIPAVIIGSTEGGRQKLLKIDGRVQYLRRPDGEEEDGKIPDEKSLEEKFRESGYAEEIDEELAREDESEQE